MIDFELGQELETLRDLVRAFVREVAIPAENRDHSEHGLDPELRAELQAHVAEAAVRVVDRSAQICGALGVSGDAPLARLMNEVRPFRIYDCSTETHLWSIARRTLKARAAVGVSDLSRHIRPVKSDTPGGVAGAAR